MTRYLPYDDEIWPWVLGAVMIAGVMFGWQLG